MCDLDVYLIVNPRPTPKKSKIRNQTIFFHEGVKRKIGRKTFQSFCGKFLFHAFMKISNVLFLKSRWSVEVLVNG